MSKKWLPLIGRRLEQYEMHKYGFFKLTFLTYVVENYFEVVAMHAAIASEGYKFTMYILIK